MANTNNKSRGGLPLQFIRMAVGASGLATTGQRLTYAMMLSHADKSYECWPGETRLARYNGVEVRQIRKNLRVLVKAKLARKGSMRPIKLPDGRMSKLRAYRMAFPESVQKAVQEKADRARGR